MVEHPKSLLGMPEGAVCAGCRGLILDQYLLTLNHALWHERCVRCGVCGEQLKNSCFMRDKKLYCKQDYSKLFAVRCAGCAEAISPAELVLRAGSAVFHQRCFSCSVCSCPLQTGDRCSLRGGQLLCARHLDQGLASPASSHSGKTDEEEEEEEEEEESVKSSIRRSGGAEDPELKRPKRPRTILTTQQRRAFKASFEVSSKPCRKVRETLAAESGLSVRVVQVWFQNQRAKMKKLARRQQQQQQQSSRPEHQNHPALHTVPSCGSVTSDLEPLGSYHSLQQQQGGVTTLEQQDYDLDPFKHGLTPPQMPGDHMHPYGCRGLYDDMDVAPLCHLGDGSFLSLGDSSLLTPIDRLCSMQDSYFTT